MKNDRGTLLKVEKTGLRRSKLEKKKNRWRARGGRGRSARGESVEVLVNKRHTRGFCQLKVWAETAGAEDGRSDGAVNTSHEMRSPSSNISRWGGLLQIRRGGA